MTCWRRLRDRQTAGVWDRLHELLLAELRATSRLDLAQGDRGVNPKLAHIMPQVASMGAAVAIVDVDADGHCRFYVTNSKEGSRNRLYRNRGDGTFEDIAGRLGVADLNQPETGVSMGAVFGDYDNDGFEDLFLYQVGPARAVSQRAGAGSRASPRRRGAAGLGQHQHRGVARLR